MRRIKNLIVTAACLLIVANCKLYAQNGPDAWDLQTCIGYALANNISIQKNRLASESSHIDVLTAKANLFPNLSFSTSHNYVNRPYPANSGISKNSYNANYGLNTSWTVFNGGRNTKTISQQELNKQISDLNVSDSENSIIESITQLYIQILYANESVLINENSLAVSEAQMNRSRELLAAGSISKSDYAQLETQYSNDNYQLIYSQAALQEYKLQLKQLLELDGSDEINIALPALGDENILVPLPDKNDVYHKALVFRPEIEAARLNMETSELGIDIARADYYPSINISGGIGTNHTSGGFSFSDQVKNGWNNSVGVTLSFPIFNNRQTKSAVQKARLNYTSSKLDKLNTEKNLYRTIEGYWLDALTAQQKYVAAQEKLRSSETSYELVNEQFILGMKNTVELLTEKNNLLSARQELIQAKYMAILSLQLLNFYQGEEIHI